MPKLGYALTAPKEEVRQMVEEAVSNSPDLITAMESIGAMYGIPSTNIMENPNAKKISIMNDTIVCPSGVKANGNTTAIMRSISGVLDQISKRVDDKITDIQTTNINNGQHDESLLNRMDPSKGKVVITTVDANGEPVIVYDSGIIDCAHTPAGRAKADELRSQGNIPTFDPLKKEKPSYFNDDDDVLKGVDMNASNKNLMQHVTECSYADVCDVPGYYIDAIAKNGDTRTLGYAILSRQGYDVQPMYDTYMEAANVKSLNPEDLKHMKFDNRNILEAVEYLNEARKAQPNVTKASDLNMDELVNNPGYKKAIICLEKQFDCHLAIKWIHANQNESMAGTSIIETEYRTRLTCSKSKGFQLGGAPIHIYVVENGVADLIPDDPDLFGQSVVSILLHEIFHNIAGIMRYETGQFITTLNIAINEAAATRDPKTRRVIIEKYVEALNMQSKGKLNRVTRKLLAKRLLTLVNEQSQVQMNAPTDTKTEDAETRKRNAEKELKAYTKAYKNAVKNKPTGTPLGVTGMTFGGIFAILAIIAGVTGTPGVMATSIGMSLGMFGMGATGFAVEGHYKKLRKLYKNSKDMEEYYADLMSGMYQLPQRFFNAASRKKYSANEVSQETLNEWVKVEKCAYESLIMAEYPTTSERTYAGVRIAQNLLTCENLDPAVEKYLKWIVENNDQILKTGIDKDYNTHTFDPAEAEDLDKHLVSMVKNNKVTVTESYAEDLIRSTKPIDEYDELIQELCELTDHISFIADMIQEGYFDTTITEAYATKVTGYTGESFIKRVLLAIPRLLKKLFEMYMRFVNWLLDKIQIGANKLVFRDRMYKSKYDLKMLDDMYTTLGQYVDRIYEILNGASTFEEYRVRMKKLVDIDVKELMKKIDIEYTEPMKITKKPEGTPEKKEPPQNGFSINGKEINRILKHILDYTRSDIAPKLGRLEKQYDIFVKDYLHTTNSEARHIANYGGKDPSADPDTKVFAEGLKIFQLITDRAFVLTQDVQAAADLLFKAQRADKFDTNKDNDKKVIDEDFIRSYIKKHKIDPSEGGKIMIAEKRWVVSEMPSLKNDVDLKTGSHNMFIGYMPPEHKGGGISYLTPVDAYMLKGFSQDTLDRFQKEHMIVFTPKE